MAEPIYVSMLGTFTVQKDGSQIDDSSNRMRKVWLLLAYLIYNRKSHTSQEQLLSLTQGDAEVDDPSGRLKALFYRVRAMLEPLGKGVGHELIVHKNGRYVWNTDIPLTLDIEEFDRIFAEASRASSDDDRLPLLLEALALYKGDFLPKLSAESWVIPISAYYHQRYLEAASAALALLCDRSRFNEALDILKQALRIEPYSEELYQYEMRCLMATGRSADALTAYESMSKLLFDAFGVMPSDESRALYRDASREDTGSQTVTVPVDSVRDQLKETDASKGAVYCEYDFFKLLYQVQSRSIIRSGDVIHIALFSIRGKDSRSLPRRSLDVAMENLRELAVYSLRQGDVVTKCSASQLIVMLPQANYENSQLVCRRILKAFNRQFPHSPADIDFHVHPLEPTATGLPR